MTWASIWNRLKGRPADHASALDEELAFHMEMKTRELATAGLDEKAAREQARRELGNLTLVNEEAREAWCFIWMRDALLDLRYGVRALRAQPGFAVAAIVALVLGIGVNALLFNVYNALALAPFAIRNPGAAVQLWSERGTKWGGFSWPEFRYLRAHTQTLEGLAAHTRMQVRYGLQDEPWTGGVVPASENFFDLLGVGFAAGRGFSAEARARDPIAEVVLHYDTWQTRFGGNPQIVGQWISVSGRRFQVVGVAAAGFAGPSPVHPSMWIPGAWRDVLEPGINMINDPDSCCVEVIGSLKPGTSRATVQAELTILSARFRESVKQQQSRLKLTALTLLSNPKAQSAALPWFVAMAATAGLILLLACANVANLQIARAAARRREMAVRLSLGAGRLRILRQLVVESLLLASVAGAISLAITAWAPRPMIAALVQESRLAIRFDNDYRVVGFVAAITVLAAFVTGLAPAFGVIREDISRALGQGGRSTATGARLRRVLLAAQVGLSAVLLAGALLLVRAAQTARSHDPGFAYDRVVLMTLGLDSSGANDEQARELIGTLIDRIAAVPGVESVAHAVAPAFGDTNMHMGIPDHANRGQLSVGFDRVSAGYFQTLRIPLLAGAAPSRADEARGEVVVVNQAAAERLWPGLNPLGRPLHPGSKTLIAGVTPNITTRQTGSEGNPHVWITSRPQRNSKLLIRLASGNTASLAGSLAAMAHQLDQRFMATAAPYSQTVAGGLRAAHITAGVAGLLGMLALLLASVGIYGVAAYDVSQRSREIGLRIALGALPGQVMAMILRQNLWMVGAGTLAGVAGAIAFGQLLKGLIYGVVPIDGAALSGTVAALTFSSVVATMGPALRASSIDPSFVLRDD